MDQLQGDGTRDGGREREGKRWWMRDFCLLGLASLSLTSTTSHMANHLITTTESFTATSFTKVLFDGSMLSIDMASQIMLALKVQLASRVFTRKRERIGMDRHMRLELSTRREGLGACTARVRLCRTR